MPFAAKCTKEHAASQQKLKAFVLWYDALNPYDVFQRQIDEKNLFDNHPILPSVCKVPVKTTLPTSLGHGPFVLAN